MTRAMKRSATPNRMTIWAPAWAVVVLCIGAGCTICPDPFDYSGPVPNGSAPQNDFRARSNGTRPVGGVPRPWPPVVQAAPGDDDATTRTAIAAAETPADADAEDTSDTVAEPAVQPAGAEVGDAEADTGSQPVHAEPTLDEIIPPSPPPRPEIAPPLRETPGWRTRD
jgi:hypothetical protein